MINGIVAVAAEEGRFCSMIIDVIIIVAAVDQCIFADVFNGIITRAAADCIILPGVPISDGIITVAAVD